MPNNVGIAIGGLKPLGPDALGESVKSQDPEFVARNVETVRILASDTLNYATEKLNKGAQCDGFNPEDVIHIIERAKNVLGIRTDNQSTDENELLSE